MYTQFGFVATKSTTGATFIVQKLQEKYIDKKKELYHTFVDWEKVFYKVPIPAVRRHCAGRRFQRGQ